MDLQHYQAQLTPAQIQQQALEKKQKMAKRKAIRKKRVRRETGKGWGGSFVKSLGILCMYFSCMLTVGLKYELE